MELIDGKDSEEEINLIIETVVDPDTDAMVVSKAIVENLVDTVSKIVREGVS